MPVSCLTPTDPHGSPGQICLGRRRISGEKKEPHTMRLRLIARSLLFALFLLSVSAATFAQIGVGISVGFGPPAIPVYEQPICPTEGYLWTPGYWAWDGDDSDYYWVP